MCVKLPMCREEMLRVSGVGEFKFEKYGEWFLECIIEHIGGVRQKFYFGEETEAVIPERKNRREKVEKTEFSISEEMDQRISYIENAYLGDFVGLLNALRDERAGIAVGTRISAKGNSYETLVYGVEIQKMIVERYREKKVSHHDTL